MRGKEKDACAAHLAWLHSSPLHPGSDLTLSGCSPGVRSSGSSGAAGSPSPPLPPTSRPRQRRSACLCNAKRVTARQPKRPAAFLLLACTSGIELVREHECDCTRSRHLIAIVFTYIITSGSVLSGQSTLWPQYRPSEPLHHRFYWIFLKMRSQLVHHFS